jgi:hypothetical protein
VRGLCDQFLKSQGRPPAYDDWALLPERVLGEIIPDAWKFDLVIVDEGQDFEQEWVEILRLFLRDQPDMVWLEDPDQNVRENARRPVSGGLTKHRRLARNGVPDPTSPRASRARGNPQIPRSSGQLLDGTLGPDMYKAVTGL